MSLFGLALREEKHILRHRTVKMELPHFFTTTRAPACVFRRSSIKSRSSCHLFTAKPPWRGSPTGGCWFAQKNSRGYCSRCGRPGPVHDHLKQRRFEFVPLRGILVFLAYRMTRVNCKRCGVTVEMVPWGHG